MQLQSLHRRLQILRTVAVSLILATLLGTAGLFLVPDGLVQDLGMFTVLCSAFAAMIVSQFAFIAGEWARHHPLGHPVVTIEEIAETMYRMDQPGSATPFAQYMARGHYLRKAKAYVAMFNRDPMPPHVRRLFFSDI